jgi:hypothetical protein
MTNLILTSSPWLLLGAPNVPTTCTPQPTDEKWRKLMRNGPNDNNVDKSTTTDRGIKYGRIPAAADAVTVYRKQVLLN